MCKKKKLKYRISQIFSAKYVKFTLGVILGIAIGIILTKSFLPQDKVIAYFERYKRATALYKIASKFPPSNIQSVRARAQASAILHGKSDYHFDTGINPAAGK